MVFGAVSKLFFIGGTTRPYFLFIEKRTLK